jgi:hypothetical protein
MFDFANIGIIFGSAKALGEKLSKKRASNSWKPLFREGVSASLPLDVSKIT